jgi:2-dehydro-3-deoxygluconokinase
MTRPKTVTFGELVLHLNAPGHERLLQSNVLNASFGGAEANVAVSLAQFGLDSHFVSRLPDNAIGDAAVRSLRAEGVDVEAVQRGGSRIGIYFTETGASQRPSRVIYDRASSGLTELEPKHIPWSEIFRGARWFHTTGITPALGKGVAECTREALVAARARGAKVSFDVNYRSMLWSEAEARQVIRPLLRHVDLLIANEEHLTNLLAASPTRVEATTTEARLEALRDAAERVAAEHGIKQVAITMRESPKANINAWSAALYDATSKRLHRGPRYVVDLVERIGGGDAFAAGLIFALIDEKAPDEALHFAIAAGALKLTVVGDFNRVTASEVERLVAGEEGSRIHR